MYPRTLIKFLQHNRFDKQTAIDDVIRRAGSWWCMVKKAKPHPKHAILKAYRKDCNPRKVNLLTKTYRDENGEPFVLPVVRKAEANLLKRLGQCSNHGVVVSPTGSDTFSRHALELAIGENNHIMEDGNFVAIQTVSATGGLRVGAEFLKRFFPGKKLIYMPDPIKTSHRLIFETCGLCVEKYKYYDRKTRGLDMDGLLCDLHSMEKNSIILLHTATHTPTGVRMKHGLWGEVSDMIKEKSIFPFFVMAHQGLVSGDLEDDAMPVKMFINDGHSLALVQSFSKTMGLYGERVGALTFTLTNRKQRGKVLSQLKRIIIPMYLAPPRHGALIADEILTDENLREEWFSQVKRIAELTIEMRKELVYNLEMLGSQKNWLHLIEQGGMYSYSGLNRGETHILQNIYSVYMPRTGRISMAGVRHENVEYLAKAIHEAVSWGTKKRKPVCKPKKICGRMKPKCVQPKKSETCKKPCKPSTFGRSKLKCEEKRESRKKKTKACRDLNKPTKTCKGKSKSQKKKK